MSNKACNCGKSLYNKGQKVRFRAGCDSPPAVIARDHLIPRSRGEQVLTRCDSGADGTVRMEETADKFCLIALL
jgi:hypothetical protein